MKLVFLLLTFSSFLSWGSSSLYESWEEKRLQGKIHEAKSLLDSLLEKCEEWEQGSIASQLTLCTLARVEEMNQGSALSQFTIAKKISSAIEKLKSEKKLPLKERLLWEARLYASLPPAYGQSFRKSLFALESLVRLVPEMTLPSFLLAEVRFLQSNPSLGEELLAQTNDPRKTFVENHLARLTRGESYGVVPRIFIRPESSAGISVQAYDDRFLDRALAYSVGASGGLKSYYSAQGIFTAEAFPFSGEIETDWKAFRENHYGVGNQSSIGAKTEIKRNYTRNTVLGRYYFTRDFSLGVGGGLLGEESVGNTFHLGPRITLDWHTLDFWARGEFLAYLTALGSTYAVQTFTAELRKNIFLSARFQSKHGVCLTVAEGDVSYATLLRYGESCDVPGTRRGRFKDRALYSLWSEVDYRLWGPVTLGAFGSLGSVAPQFSSLLGESLHPGAGLVMQWQFTRFPRADVRLEAAVHGGEFLVNVGVEKPL